MTHDTFANAVFAWCGLVALMVSRGYSNCNGWFWSSSDSKVNPPFDVNWNGESEHLKTRSSASQNGTEPFCSFESFMWFFGKSCSKSCSF